MSEAEHVSVGMNACVVKYIDIGSIRGDDLGLDIDKFVRCKQKIWHRTYEEMHTRVFEFQGLPTAYRCMEPLALHHEVLWSSGIYIDDGVSRGRVVGHDQLHHAIEEKEYATLWEGRNAQIPLPIFVDIEKVPTALENYAIT